MTNPLGLFLASRYGSGPKTAAALAHSQERGFTHLRRKIMPKSPYYAAFAQRPFTEWPMMNKARMLEHFSAINTAGLTHDMALKVALRAEQERDFTPMIGKVAIGLSTGTSGQRGLFASNARERALWAAVMLGRFLPNLLTRQRIAFFLRANNRLYESLSTPMIGFRFYDLLEPFDGHLAHLVGQNPTVLVAPAQILGLLAQAHLAGNLAIRPKRVISVAEVLSPEDESAISAAFGVKVDQVYQCTEGMLGMTCPAGHLHMNEDHLYIERDVIDDGTGAFHPIITDLTRETQPIIRYRLDDVLIPDPTPCACGSVRLRLKRIEGRADDIVYWQRLAGGRCMIPSDAIRQAMATATTGIRDYRVVQTGLSRMDLSIDTSTPLTAENELRANLETLARNHGAQLPELHFHHAIPNDPATKRRRVIVRPDPSESIAKLSDAQNGG